MQRTNLIFKLIIFTTLTLLVVGCSSSRRLQRQQSDAVYARLGLEKDRKDNFQLYKEAASWLGVPHRDGGLSKNGIDCSGLVKVIYSEVYDKKIERNSEAIYRNNCRKKRKSSLKEGDLVFFKTTNKSRSKINHVGVYLKDNYFLHTSSSRGVMVSNLKEDYFRKAWVCGGRVK